MNGFTNLFGALWEQYSRVNVQAGKIHQLLENLGEKIVHDHVAFRTFGLPGINIAALAQHFQKYGYVEKGEYFFKEKKLRAKHFELEGYPRVFISELIVEGFSPYLQETVKKLVSSLNFEEVQKESFLYSGVKWEKIDYATYQKLLNESEYAAWMASFGYVANHFTIAVNHLNKFKNLAELNQFLKNNGFVLNQAGGEIKGSKEVFLEQSATLAAEVKVNFGGEERLVPCCYYEFAERFKMADGKYFSGFVEGNADKIFQSTDVRR